MAKAYSYLRFSTPEQERGDSFRRQTELARAYALRHGLQLDERLKIEDKGVSAFRGLNARTGALGAFLRAVDDGDVEPGAYLLVENLDRVSRQDPWDALPVFQQIINAGVTIVTLQDEKLYSRDELRANPLKILESLFVMIRANEESATKSRRLSAAWTNKRAKATERPLTSRGPAWLRLDKVTGQWNVLEDRAAVVRRIFQLAQSGVGQHATAELLNKQAVPVFGDGSRRARHWHKSYVAKILASPAVVGTLVPHVSSYDGGRYVRTPQPPVHGYYPALVDTAVWERLQEVRNSRGATPRHHAGKVQNILGGLATCAACGASMTRIWKGSIKGGRPLLVCTRWKAGAAKGGVRCPYKPVRCEDVEAALLRRPEDLVKEAPAGADGTSIDVQLRELDEAIAGLEQHAEALLDDYLASRSATAAARLHVIESDLPNMRIQRAELLRQKDVVSGPAVRRKLAALAKLLSSDPAQLDRGAVNVALRGLCDRVVVNYLSGYLEFEWRHGGRSQLVYAWPEGVRGVA